MSAPNPDMGDHSQIVSAALTDLRAAGEKVISTCLAKTGLNGTLIVPQLVSLARKTGLGLCERLENTHAATSKGTLSILVKDAIAASVERLFRTIQFLVDEQAELLSHRIREALSDPRSELLDRLFGKPRPDHELMELAVEQAKLSPREQGQIKPSPKVGAVVVRDGRILAAAFRGEGHAGDHAEFVALEKKLAGVVLEGTTVFTT